MSIVHDTLVKSLHQSSAETAQLVRDHCQAQLEIWKEVPYWGYMAEGRNGWGGSGWYSSGHWAIINQGRTVRFSLVVDCETGDILHHGLKASNAAILFLANSLELIDAVAIVSTLMHRSLVPILSSASGVTEESLSARKLKRYGPPPQRPFARS